MQASFHTPTIAMQAKYGNSGAYFRAKSAVQKTPVTLMRDKTYKSGVVKAYESIPCHMSHGGDYFYMAIKPGSFSPDYLSDVDLVAVIPDGMSVSSVMKNIQVRIDNDLVDEWKGEFIEDRLALVGKKIRTIGSSGFTVIPLEMYPFAGGEMWPLNWDWRSISIRVKTSVPLSDWALWGKVHHLTTASPAFSPKGFWVRSLQTGSQESVILHEGDNKIRLYGCVGRVRSLFVTPSTGISGLGLVVHGMRCAGGPTEMLRHVVPDGPLSITFDGEPLSVEKNDIVELGVTSALPAVDVIVVWVVEGDIELLGPTECTHESGCCAKPSGFRLIR